MFLITTFMAGVQPIIWYIPDYERVKTMIDLIINAMSDLPFIGIVFYCFTYKTFPDISAPGELLNLTQEIMEFLILALVSNKAADFITGLFYKNSFKANLFDKFFSFPGKLIIKMIVQLACTVIVSVLISAAFQAGGVGMKGFITIVFFVVAVLLVLVLGKTEAAKRIAAIDLVSSIITTLCALALCTIIYMGSNSGKWIIWIIVIWGIVGVIKEILVSSIKNSIK